jgi:hypothetical protein
VISLSEILTQEPQRHKLSAHIYRLVGLGKGREKIFHLPQETAKSRDTTGTRLSPSKSGHYSQVCCSRKGLALSQWQRWSAGLHAPFGPSQVLALSTDKQETKDTAHPQGGSLWPGFTNIYHNTHKHNQATALQQRCKDLPPQEAMS